MQAQFPGLLGTGIGLGVVLGVVITTVWFVVYLSQKRIAFSDRPKLPAFFPRNFSRHTFAANIMIELLNVKRESGKGTWSAQLAKWVGCSRTSAVETVEYLEGLHFVTVVHGTKRHYVALTLDGEKAAGWLEQNFSPDIASYLQKIYPDDLFAAIANVRHFKTVALARLKRLRRSE